MTNVMKWGKGVLATHDFSALRLPGPLGEPMNPEALMRYHKGIPGHRGPDFRHVVTKRLARSNTQSSGVVTTKPVAAMTGFTRVTADVVDDSSNSAGIGNAACWVTTKPWPVRFRGMSGYPARHEESHRSRLPGRYCAWDVATKDGDACRPLGPVDDLIHLSLRTILTTEIEHAFLAHPSSDNLSSRNTGRDGL